MSHLLSPQSPNPELEGACMVLSYLYAKAREEREKEEEQRKARIEERGRILGVEQGIAIGIERGIGLGFEQGKALAQELGATEARKVHDQWQAWYIRMLQARVRGEEFDELPPGYDQSQTGE